ncbi:GAF and ANTAR domain-containing protein [Arthrobacter monumenti]
MTAQLPLADELAAVAARASGFLLDEDTVAAALCLITSTAAESVPGASGSGVTLIDPSGRQSTSAASDPVVEQVDQLQYDLGEGPCLTAWATTSVIRMDDAASESRWPRWTTAVQTLPLRSSVSVPLSVGTTALGAMKIYSPEPAAFDERSERLLQLLAAQAAILVANVQARRSAQRISDNLRENLHSRDIISTAAGILLERDGLTIEEAVSVLMASARREDTALVEVAENLVKSTINAGE